MKRIVVMGGGTFSHIRNHLALCAPAFGTTAIQLHQRLLKCKEYETDLVLTRMAEPNSAIMTNDHVDAVVDALVADPNVRAIVFNMALCDFKAQVGGVPSGPHAERLKTSQGSQALLLTPTDKLIGKIRRTRKDIFVVGFKTTTGAVFEDQYAAGLSLLKKNSLNLVLANDTVTRKNMVIYPEETQTYFGSQREDALDKLVEVMLARMSNTFTRSTVVSGPAALYGWNSTNLPENFRKVVNHCINRGAYKPVLGKTAGHFAAKLNDKEIVTTIRKTNFNEDLKLVHVKSDGPNNVTAFGAKPSVGGQSQRIIFAEHPEADCIVHFHSPMTYSGEAIPVRPQQPFECGSHECGKNTSDGLKEFDLGDGDKVKAVHLSGHGPNIVFSRSTNPDKVIDFIERNWSLDDKTGGLGALRAQ